MLRLVRDTQTDSGPTTIADTLMMLHDRWLSKLRQFVARILALEVDPLERWTIVRDLDEELGRWYSGEVELARLLTPLVPTGTVRRLGRAEEAISRVREEVRQTKLDPDSVALRAAVLDLLDALQLWCAELELAASDLAASQLSDEGQAILHRLDVAS